MSLLLDARKKAQQARSGGESAHAPKAGDFSLQEHPVAEGEAAPSVTPPPTVDVQAARDAGRKLFNAKSGGIRTQAVPNRNLLFALGGTLLLLGAGGAYLWYLDTASDTTPLHPVAAPPLAQQPPADAQAALVPGIAAPAAPEMAAPEAPASEPEVAPPAEDMAAPAPRPASSAPIRIERQPAELLDPLLRNAYQAYRSGKLDEAWNLYMAMYRKDARNIDALLGLAAIAEQRGEDSMAAQYFGQVLVLDPRHPLANAGISALNANEDASESRLKMLLREQGNAPALHFALGNLYAGQTRWAEAQQAYFNAWSLDPGNAEYAFNLAVSLDHLGQKELAARYYQDALQLDAPQTAGFDHAAVSLRVQELTH